MRIGITCDLKTDGPHALGQSGNGFSPGQPGGPAETEPDDSQEEFDSPATIAALAGVLRSLGHDVEQLGDGRELLQRLLADPPDFVFNIAEGHGVGRAREARVPAVLEMLGIPYTGSDPLTLAVTLEKDCAKRLVQSEGVAVPGGAVISCPQSPTEIANCKLQFAICNLQFPLIVKPAWEGSSKGIRGKCLVDNLAELTTAVEALWRGYRQPVLVEEFIEGEELTVGMVGNDPPQVVGVLRVVPLGPAERFIYSLEVKRDWRRQVRYECPARLPPGQMEAVEEAARKVYWVLGCRDVSRIDFRLRDGVPYFIEVNPLPGLNPESSDLVILAQLAGWTYERLIETILQAAVNRQAAPVPAGTTVTP